MGLPGWPRLIPLAIVQEEEEIFATLCSNLQAHSTDKEMAADDGDNLFGDIGRQPGVYKWRVESLKPVVQPFSGQLHTGGDHAASPLLRSAFCPVTLPCAHLLQRCLRLSASFPRIPSRVYPMPTLSPAEPQVPQWRPLCGFAFPWTQMLRSFSRWAFSAAPGSPLRPRQRL